MAKSRPKGDDATGVDRDRMLPKAPTGVLGLDQITGGGLPRGRPTLVCGGAGCGKTMLAAEFLVRGATEFDEPGVLMTFEETAAELAQNLRSLGIDLERLVQKKRIAVDHVHVERSEIEETGEYDLEGLFIRLGHAIDTVGAKRVVLDSLDVLFTGLPDENILRAELRRLFHWLKARGVTAIITGERGESSLTRHGLEEYVADCVILLDHRIVDQVSTRRLRVVKYRGSAHGTNEYPFMIGDRGVSVLPVTSLRLEYGASTKRMATGVAGIDAMLGGKGVFRGSSVLVTGAPGSGKSTIGTAFARAACERGERALIFTYEESPSQLVRNMRSIGMHLQSHVDAGRLRIHASRPPLDGLEQFLVAMHHEVINFAPHVVVMDPISNLSLERDEVGLKPTLMRLVDFLRQAGITGVFTALTTDLPHPESDSQLGVSSLMDTWLMLTNRESNGERTRTVQVVKARGMAHSNQVREWIFTSRGIELIDVYRHEGRVLTGEARAADQRRSDQVARRGVRR
jgi:circadian clock protein KaiC